MAYRKIGDKVKLTKSALKLRPDLKGEVGVITYRPMMTYKLGQKQGRGRIMYNVKFKYGNEPRQFGAFANQIESA